MDNEAYWINRHERLRHRLAAVGNIGSSEDDNLERYARKKRRVADLLRSLDRTDLSRNSVLDAGCGIGLVSELFYILGGEISGVDASPIAVEEARHRCPGGVFKVASLLEFQFGKKFDFTFCLDVLYHIVNDDNWRTVLQNLVSHTADGGHLIILDQLKDIPNNPAEHVRFRTKAMYDCALTNMNARDCTPKNQHHFIVYRVTG